MLAPILPLYVTQLGGSPFIVGMVLATFAATSVIIRPLVGHWADRWSEAGVMIAGLLFQGASIFFCFIPWIGTTMLANGLRGIGWGGLNTGGYSLLARAEDHQPEYLTTELYTVTCFGEVNRQSELVATFSEDTHRKRSRKGRPCRRYRRNDTK